MTATMLATAWLVQKLGERAAFVGMLTVFLGASLLAAASWSTHALIVARVIQGGAAEEVNHVGDDGSRRVDITEGQQYVSLN